MTDRLRGVSALVVDDNNTNRRILEEILRQWRMRPTVVGSGAEALTALQLAAKRNRPFSLVLLDAQMPAMDGFMLVEQIKANSDIAGSTLMMLSSAAQFSDAQRCRDLGVAAYLTKPIKQSELLDAILRLMNPPPLDSETEASSKAKSRTAELSDSLWQLNILLAEDNPVNQRVAAGILEKRGHAVMAVDNGQQALYALEAQQFDLILMDLQMPEMDGFAATAAIREREAATGGHLPIVAMTARAMKGDRECCLEAGMDGYVSKPVNPQELMAVIESLVPMESAGQTTKVTDDDPPCASQLTCPEYTVRHASDTSVTTNEDAPTIHFESLLRGSRTIRPWPTR